MVRSSKWIRGVRPEQPVTEVARKSLRARLDTIWYYAPLAAKKAHKDIEYVHQLRVSVRRARAAINVYEGLMARKPMKSMNKLLRDLRKSASDARDLDVLAERLSSLPDQKKQRDLRRVLKEIAAHRQDAQEPLLRSYKQAKQIGFKRRSRGLLNRIRWKCGQPEPTFYDFARNTFKSTVDEFFTAADADLSDVDALHQMRISGKRVRYAMELLAGAFNDSFREQLYPVFGEIQEQLGAINDHVTAIALFDRWIERGNNNGRQTTIGALIATETSQLDDARRQFLDWWTADRAAALAEQIRAALEPDQQTMPLASPTFREPSDDAQISSAG